MNLVKKNLFGKVEAIQLGFGPIGRPLMSVFLYIIDGVVIDTGQQGFLKRALQPNYLSISSHWLRNGGTRPYRIRLDMEMCGWDLKWVTSFANYTAFGKVYQHNANGGGRQKMNEIMGEALDCDTARVYDATVVRKVTAEMPE